jgi:hypothetical protein
LGHEAQDAADLIKVDVKAAGEFETGVFFAVNLGVNATQFYLTPTNSLMKRSTGC